jgi:hypothetical protein
MANITFNYLYIVNMFRIISLMALFVLFYDKSYAQCRIVFFREDPALISPLYTKCYIYHNDNIIHKTIKRTVWINESKNLTGSYYISPGKSNTVPIDCNNGEIIFVKLKRDIGYYEAKTSISILSKSDFTKYYNKHRWLRRKIRKSGYNTIDQLCKGWVSTNENS